MRTKTKNLPKSARKALMTLDCAIAAGDEEGVQRSVGVIEDNFIFAAETIGQGQLRLSYLHRRLKWAAKREGREVSLFARELLEVFK